MLISIFDPMGAQTDRLRCEVYQNLILSPMNTGLLRHAVATAPTVYGIETHRELKWLRPNKLQQHLPFTVLKLEFKAVSDADSRELQQHLPFTVLKQHRTHLHRCFLY